MSFMQEYNKLVEERAALGIPPLPLNANQTRELCKLLENENNEELANLLENRVNPGVDDAALVKCEFLDSILKGKISAPNIDKKRALRMLGTMLGGYNVKVLIDALKDENIAKDSAEVLKNIIFVHDNFHTIAELSKNNPHAKEVLQSWANADWFNKKEKLPQVIKCIVFKVAGETNTDDLSPAGDAFTRSDIPLHANAMLKVRQAGSLEKIKELKKSGREVVYVGDVVGTGSSRKSAINSIQWHLGKEIEGVPNKHSGGIVMGSTIAPIFFNTAQDSGALPIICDVTNLEMGDEFEIHPYEGKIIKNGSTIAEFTLSPNALLDEVRAGGRIPLIIGRGLCAKARDF